MVDHSDWKPSSYFDGADIFEMTHVIQHSIDEIGHFSFSSSMLLSTWFYTRYNNLRTSLLLMSATLLNTIRRLRFERGVTQEELAMRVGVSRQTVMSIERGETNPSVLLAYKIAVALEAPLTQVFQMEGELMPV